MSADAAKWPRSVDGALTARGKDMILGRTAGRGAAWSLGSTILVLSAFARAAPGFRRLKPLSAIGSRVNDIAVTDELLCLVTTNELRIFRAGKGTEPVECSRTLFDVDGRFDKIAVRDDLAYIRCGVEKAGSLLHALLVVEIADPLRPRLLRAVGPFRWGLYDMTFSGGHAYWACRQGAGIARVDQAGTFEFVKYGCALEIKRRTSSYSEGARLVALSGKRLAVMGPRYLRVYELDSPTEPRELGRMNVWAEISDERTLEMRWRGDSLVLFRESEIVVVDASNPARLRAAGRSRHLLRNGRILVDEKTLYVSRSMSLLACDISRPLAPKALWRRSLSSPAGAMAIKDGVLHLSCQSGLDRYELRGSDKPGSGEPLLIFPRAKDAYMSGKYLYLFTWSRWPVWILDISRPAAPRVVRRLQIEERYSYRSQLERPVTALESGLLVCAFSRGFHVLSIREPLSPEVVGTYELSDHKRLRDFWTSDGKTLYLATSDGMRVVDITDPAKPRETASIDVPPRGLRRIVACGRWIVAAAETQSVDERRIWAFDAEKLSRVRWVDAGWPKALSYGELGSSGARVFVSCCGTGSQRKMVDRLRITAEGRLEREARWPLDTYEEVIVSGSLLFGPLFVADISRGFDPRLVRRHYRPDSIRSACLSGEVVCEVCLNGVYLYHCVEERGDAPTGIAHADVYQTHVVTPKFEPLEVR